MKIYVFKDSPHVPRAKGMADDDVGADVSNAMRRAEDER